MKKGVISVLSAMAGMLFSAGMIGKKLGRELGRKQNMSDKHLALFLMMNQWVRVKQEGKSLAGHLEKTGYRTVAVYGMSYAGERLCAELKDSTVTIKYAIDRNAASMDSEVKVVSPDDVLENVDAVIVTSISAIVEITDLLSEKVNCPILSLEDILYEM